MYNGIGLQTPRGSGTNGYVQRNLAFVKGKKDKVDYKTEEEINKLDQSLNKQPNKEILDHERKRKVELKCMEMQELMEEQGYSEKEVRDKVNMFRKMLMAKEGVSESTAVDRDEHGRPIARETHQLAEANQEKNARLKEAFGLTDYVDGSAFDPDRKAKEEAAKAAAAAQKKYSLVQSSEEDEGKEEASIPHKKKKKRSRHDSTSPDRSKEKRRKSRKHSKRDRSHSKKSKKSKHRSKRRSSGKRKHRRHHSTSSSDSDSHDDSGESDTVDLKDKDEMSAVKTNGLTLSPLQSLVVQRKESTPPILPPPQTCQIINKSSPPKTMVSPKVDTGSNMKYPNEGGTLSRAKSRSASRSRSRSNSYHSHSYRRSTRRSSSKSSSSRSRSRTHSPTFSLRRHSHSKSHSRSRSRSRSPSSGSDHRGGHRDSRSPSIRRRHGSPSHLDKRRITSARKRPVPYYRPSPSPSQSDSDNSFSLRRSRSKSHTSRSRFRSLSRSPSLDLHYRRRKQPQRNQNPTEYHPPQQHYFHQPLHQHVAHSTPASSVPPFASQYPATCLISQ
ncbi:unnamed protein product [Lymnaea stagnalis]|uniref:CWF21 domain-containing protein n=1 Tax=Lymnaea stagnalis TaxID=6523 RepID=A0AAV2I6N5_LYMST